MRLTPPDPLSTILLYLGAATMAINAALGPGTPVTKKFPGLTMDGAWPYVPIILMTLAAVIWIVRGLNGGKTGTMTAKTQGQEPSPTPPREPWLTPYLKGFIVIMTMMIIYSFASNLISHLFPPNH